MKKIILGFILGGIVFTLGGVVATTAISSTNVTYQNKTVNNALDELYNEAITGKELVAAAITNKGITTTSNDTYEVMASNINNIDTDHTEINQKISNLESKHNSDIASLTGSISNLNQSLSNLSKEFKLWTNESGSFHANLEVTLNDKITNYSFLKIMIKAHHANNVIGSEIYISTALLTENCTFYRKPFFLASVGYFHLVRNDDKTLTVGLAELTASGWELDINAIYGVK